MQRNIVKTSSSASALKTVAIVALAGALTAAVGVIVHMWKNAALGREVRRTVLAALEHSGSKIHNGVISGGAMLSTMPVNAAIHATVAALIDATATTQMRRRDVGKTQHIATKAKEDEDDAKMFAKLAAEVEQHGKGGGAPADAPADNKPTEPKPSPGGSLSYAGAVVDYGEEVEYTDGPKSKSCEAATVVEYDPNEFVPTTARPPTQIPK